MSNLEQLRIDLRALTEHETMLECDLDDACFETLGGAEVNRGSVHVSLSIRKASGFYDLCYSIDGTVQVACDRCLAEMAQPVKGERRLTAKLGKSAGEDDDVVTVDENDGVIDLSWPVYETIALAIPIRHVHEPGKCDAAMTEALEAHRAARSSEDGDGAGNDARWDKLKNLTF